jgi:hypothetical protein
MLTPQEQALIDDLTEQVKAYSRQVAFDAETPADIAVDAETGEVVEPLN